MAYKSKYKPAPFESMGQSFINARGDRQADTSANIFESMLQSRAFKSLIARQQMLYVYCKAQYYGKRKPERDYQDVDAVQGADFFYLNWDAVKTLYGRYSAKDSSTFYKDMDVLIKRGFIERTASGKAQHEKTVYRFSAEWKAYDG